jgi:DNA-binding MarR family transcriptional regulator
MKRPPHPSDTNALAHQIYLSTIHLPQCMRREDDGLGQSASQLSALSTLASKGALTIRKLAAAEGVRPTSMMRMVRRLEDLKLARRKASPSDGRVIHVVYTSGTIRILEKGKAQRVRVEARRS